MHDSQIPHCSTMMEVVPSLALPDADDTHFVTDGTLLLDMDDNKQEQGSAESHQQQTLSQSEVGMDSECELLCYICQKPTEEYNKLKQCNETKWLAMKAIAALRKNLKSDKYLDVTQRISGSNTHHETFVKYHSYCYKNYTAVKRPRSASCGPPNKKPCTDTRRSSSLPRPDEQGLLKGTCIFCGHRKKVKGKEEPRLTISTLSGCQSLRQRAINSKNERIKTLISSGVDLISKQAEYHRSCRALFDKETGQVPEHSEQDCTPHYYHKSTIASLCTYIQHEVVEKKRSILVSELLDKYKAEYVEKGGDMVDVASYLPQNLVRKVNVRFGQQIKVTLLDQRKVNFISSSVLTEDDARARLQDDAERCKEDEKIKWAAFHLRSQIQQLPKTKTPQPATVQNLKESAPEIPSQLDLFFRTLQCGQTQNFSGDCKDTVDRKVTAMTSDAIYNVTRGTVKPWKHTIMGLGIASVTGSKLAMGILNRAGHSINYSDTKGLETEFAYSVESDERDTPDGIRLEANLATACVWDNNDANVETLNGKETLHATVGHTYQNALPDDRSPDINPTQFRAGRNRRKFLGNEREISPFMKPLNKAHFVSHTARTAAEATTGSQHTVASESTAEEANESNDSKMKPTLKALDLYWFCELRNGNTPLHAGFISRYINDPLPLQRICYMDPISRSPTNNDVVKETMIRTLNVAKETKQDYAVVTYDLAVALKAYAIQAIESPLFDKLLIMLGNFHIELAFYGAVGTLINESGIEFILSEAGILAEGAMMGFIKGKFYNRCTRIHEMLATVLEQKMYESFLTNITPEEQESFQLVLNTVPSDLSQVEEHLSQPTIAQHLEKYEEFFKKTLEGSHGPTAQYWAIYIFLINRLHRELQRCVKTNDVSGYIHILPKLLDVFFALNRPNYARWGTLFLRKLQNADPKLHEILEKGAFSIRRTKKEYSRSAVDLSLEQTVNRDAASQLKGIVAFRNSQNAMRRWSLTMTQRAMAVTELRTFAGLELGESASTQCRQSRIKKDNIQMAALSEKVEYFCNPFSDQVSDALVNVATGKTASNTTKSYLLNTLKRGQEARKQFQDEWNNNSSHFLKPVKRIPVHNFAAENVKQKTKSPAADMAKKNAESLRDMFIRMIIVVAQNTPFDLRNVLAYPITRYPLSIAHCDGTRVKTTKATLTKKLEGLQTEAIALSKLPRCCDVQVYDGGLVLHTILSETNAGTSYASIARRILSMLCSGNAREVHLCLDKYVENSIKASERLLRGAMDSAYVITGPEQTIRQSGQKLLNNGMFKNELSKFLLNEWKRHHYWNVLGEITFIASYGGDCFQYVPDENEIVTVTKPQHLQGDHEEADTLIAFHVANVTGKVIVRASDTDVLVILVGAVGQQLPEERSTTQIIMDCGMGNARRYLDVTTIADALDQRKPGLSRALPGYHAFTGCDFTSAFYRKGKVKPLDIIEKDKTGVFVDLFVSMGELHGNVDVDVASDFVCRMYGQNKTRDVNEARYNKLIQMSGKINADNPLTNVRKIDCASLPPSRRCLEMKLLRAHYVTMVWTLATSASPAEGLSPTDYGWRMDGGILLPCWFTGPEIPDLLFTTEKPHQSHEDYERESESESDDEAWSEASVSDVDEEDYQIN